MGWQKALELRRKYGLRGVVSDDDLGAIIANEGTEVVEYAFRSGLSEVYVDGVIYLSPTLSRGWRRWLTAHGLSHHINDAGNQLYLRRADDLRVQKQERSAEVFAGALLLLGACGLGGLATCDELAWRGEVPTACVRRWYMLICETLSPWT